MAGGKAGKRKPGKPKPTGSQRSAPAAWKVILAGRLRDVFGTMSIREIARATNHNRETVRRFLNSGNPSVAFLVEASRASGVSVDWLVGLGRKR
jgi:DNA invertase Pin-like site-specific DNA recombinase